jgi:hypothetical protein
MRFIGFPQPFGQNIPHSKAIHLRGTQCHLTAILRNSIITTSIATLSKMVLATTRRLRFGLCQRDTMAERPCVLFHHCGAHGAGAGR